MVPRIKNTETILSWRKIAISLIDPCREVLSVVACARQLPTVSLIDQPIEAASGNLTVFQIGMRSWVSGG